MYDAISERLADYEREILQQLTAMAQTDKTASLPANGNKARAIKKRGEEPLRQGLYRMNGVDLTTIDALGVETAHVILSEYGPDLSRFPTEKHFISHLRLAPHRAISGGKPVRHQKRPHRGSARVAAALRMAATSLRRSRSALGAYYRRIAQRLGADVAVFATARKLAQRVYRLLRWGQPYVDEGATAYETRYRQARITRLTATAKELGYTLVSAQA
jgi:transposase